MPDDTHDAARTWAEASKRVDRLQGSVRELQLEIEKERRRCEEAASTLGECVGPNARLRVFDLGGEVLIVEHERGIRLAEKEVNPRG